MVPLRESSAGLEVLMLRQYRLALDDTILELPAGTRERGEAWAKCAQRELREETGFRALDFKSLGNCWPAPGLSNEEMHFFIARGLEPDPLPGDSDEQIELAPRLFAELIPLALNGELRDGKSVIGILWTAAFLGWTIARTR
jgi:ADP-ribose pyrophosphatase